MRSELKLPLALMLACLIAWASVALSSAARQEHDKAARYAKVIAASANGGWFRIGATYVSCGSVEIR